MFDYAETEYLRRDQSAKSRAQKQTFTFDYAETISKGVAKDTKKTARESKHGSIFRSTIPAGAKSKGSEIACIIACSRRKKVLTRRCIRQCATPYRHLVIAPHRRHSYIRRAIFLPALTHKKSGPAYADPLKKYRVRSILQAANRKAHAPNEVRVRCETLVVRPCAPRHNNLRPSLPGSTTTSRRCTTHDPTARRRQPD